MSGKVSSIIAIVFPFLRWFPLKAASLRADFVAGVTVALVLVPQSMAYAQLAGMPAYYGLYAAFLPVIVGALWGSSSQLATGPVAVVSLITASALVPLAAAGSERFIALAILLALMVGVVQIALGLFRLGALVNLISHPVLIGFMNAAAIIIGLSQLNKVMGVSMGRSDSFIKDIWSVFQQVGDVHMPTLVIGVSAFVLIWALRKYAPRLPGVLIAVVITTLVSWSIGYERNASARIEQMMTPELRETSAAVTDNERQLAYVRGEILSRHADIKEQEKTSDPDRFAMATLHYEIDLLEGVAKDTENEHRKAVHTMRKFVLERVPGVDGGADLYYQAGKAPPDAKTDGHRWRIKKSSNDKLMLSGGGEVIGNVPAGLPAFDLPKVSWSDLASLFSTALVIAMVAFMEAIAIAKAMAAKTRERIDPDRELIGQGLANLSSCFSQSFPVSGSFSRSAVNLNAGAMTGMSSVITGVLVLLTLLFLTPLLYHLPQAVLAAIIMLAVAGLVDVKAFRHAWQTKKYEGVTAVVTFAATLYFAPHLDLGILLGAGLAIIIFLQRRMKPRAAILGRLSDGTLSSSEVPASSDRYVVLRYDGSLNFLSASHFEDAILRAHADYPQASTILVIASGINSIDATAEGKIREISRYMREAKVTLAFSSLKQPVREVFERSELIRVVGAENIFVSREIALKTLDGRLNNPNT